MKQLVTLIRTDLADKTDYSTRSIGNDQQINSSVKELVLVNRMKCYLIIFLLLIIPNVFIK
ncbi:MAG: hypothetical protein WCK78_07220 [Paludibacter sp.]